MGLFLSPAPEGCMMNVDSKIIRPLNPLLMEGFGSRLGSMTNINMINFTLLISVPIWKGVLKLGNGVSYANYTL